MGLPSVSSIPKLEMFDSVMKKDDFTPEIESQNNTDFDKSHQVGISLQDLKPNTHKK